MDDNFLNQLERHGDGLEPTSPPLAEQDGYLDIDIWEWDGRQRVRRNKKYYFKTIRAWHCRFNAVWINHARETTVIPFGNIITLRVVHNTPGHEASPEEYDYSNVCRHCLGGLHG